MYNLFLSLILQRPLPRRTFLLPDTKVPGGYDAVRCAGITTNEVLNLNKLQGTRLPSSFQLSFAPSAVYSLSVDIQNSLSHREGRHRGLEMAIWTFRAWNILAPLICSGRREWGRWWLERRYFPWGTNPRVQRRTKFFVLINVNASLYQLLSLKVYRRRNTRANTPCR